MAITRPTYHFDKSSNSPETAFYYHSKVVQLIGHIVSKVSSPFNSVGERDWALWQAYIWLYDWNIQLYTSEFNV